MSDRMIPDRLDLLVKIDRECDGVLIAHGINVAHTASPVPEMAGEIRALWAERERRKSENEGLRADVSTFRSTSDVRGRALDAAMAEWKRHAAEARAAITAEIQRADALVAARGDFCSECGDVATRWSEVGQVGLELWCDAHEPLGAAPGEVSDTNDAAPLRAIIAARRGDPVAAAIAAAPIDPRPESEGERAAVDVAKAEIAARKEMP